MKTPQFILRGGVLALAAVVLASPRHSEAGLTYDLRLSVGGGKNAVVTSVGQQISFDLYAQVTGSAAGAEGFQDGYGSILSSTNGNITGSLSAALVGNYDTKYSRPGDSSQTLDADADTDIGSNATSHNSSFFFYRSGQSAETNGNTITNGVEVKIATVIFTVGTIGSFSNTTPISLTFRPASFTTEPILPAAVWLQDGVTTNSNGLNGGTPASSSPVQLSVIPEPSSASLLGLSAMALTALRRRKR